MNQRNTIQRALVMEAARRLRHPTAEEIYTAVAEAYASISRATVYRNLSLAVGQGRLRRVAVPGSADRFDITVEGHYHLACKSCGKVVDADIPYQPELDRRIMEDSGFFIDEHEIILRGYCAACRAAERPDLP